MVRVTAPAPLVLLDLDLALRRDFGLFYIP
jgi:hypothetical protein